MRNNRDVILAYPIMLGLIILVGFLQSWSIALSILCLCLISAVMTMGANIQWGYAGLINFGIMGYTALGGLAAVLVSVPPVKEAWQVGGLNMILSVLLIALIVFGVRFITKKYKKSKRRKQMKKNLYKVAEASSGSNWQSTNSSWLLDNLEETIALGKAFISCHVASVITSCHIISFRITRVMPCQKIL